ncbi:hypothetical protein [Psychroserpens sp.]|uniref:hypothetical protein n=1 Tax=Psychroserpens sp. TaxID=2020870 RepID=UPI001B04C15F|nr:hypothetical protein [Psychroserpens sp.]MBO6607601.1 hypothetical protein [Psychroserpens sp.]MBO6631575.1 hypothetical protein [Psychroserpens sp.]MBO6655087.1 hypothetical protein [Psychroserpens sp.]MBO6683108.1 hypothetical protein [Psychroserpens sp.]MBO6749713.1 hypothetical protein [Psychroserpens sp.]
MKTFISFFLALCVLSCTSTSKEEKTVKIIDGSTLYEVYQPSEMSSLMKGMYAYNEKVKKDITKGTLSTEFPDEFLKIHTAELSDTKTRTDNFQLYSGKYIEAQRLVFVEDTVSTLVKRHNDAIDMCIACHKTECTGPIPKIKKLLISEE